MNKFLEKAVIVPWDFSEMSENALRTVLDMVDASQVEVVHVTSYPSTMEPGVVWGTITEDSIVKNLIESFDEVREKAQFPELKFTAKFGDPGGVITDLAKDRDAGLIVISSHGRTGVNRLLLGSVAERVVRLAHCPVLVLREDND